MAPDRLGKHGRGICSLLCRRRFSLLFFLVLASACEIKAYNIDNIDVQEHSGISIQVANPLSEEPRSGFLPLHVTIVNNTAKPHEWTLRTGDGGGQQLAYRTQFGAGPGETREIDLLIPQGSLAEGRTGGYRLSGTIRGYGISDAGGRFSFGGGYSGAVETAYVAMSESLADKSWSAIAAEIKACSGTRSKGQLANMRFAGVGSGSRVLMGTSLRLSEMPADARAFSGFTALWLSSGDWNALDSERRRAIREWVSDGGILLVASDLESESLDGLPKNLRAAAPVPAGFGRVALTATQDKTLPVKAAVDEILGLDAAPFPACGEDYAGKWPLLQKFEEPVLNVSLIIVFVTVFAGVIGPCNFIWFAPPRRRHRLFFTVPAISVAASATLFAAIAIGDGLGASGGRNVLVCLSAGENRCGILQEQACRSRLLVKRGFTVPEAASIAELSARSRTESGRALERSGLALSGDWFRSRAFQAQTLRMGLPARAEVVLQASASGAPVLLSSVSTTIRDVFYIDASGDYWHAESMTPGRPQSLSQSTEQIYDAWVGAVSASFSANMHTVLGSVAHRRGCFYAQGDATSEIPIQTLSSVKWPLETIVYFGPCTAAR